ncbi:MAG TPA: DNA methyltransferase [Candidatus Paceibacterota bacterium]|nr:DNA methyltransferase [Candidatus Paceibacterota bacterium]
MATKFKIYNQSSEDMSKVSDNSVDIVIFAPPYNINTPYDIQNPDSKPFDEFKNFLSAVIRESARVLKEGGIFLNESADTVWSGDRLIALSGLIQRLCLDNGLEIQARHINFLQSKDGVELTDREHAWSEKEYYSKESSHSNCHQWLIFRKGKCDFDFEAGRIYYLNYPSDEEGHPCPFSPQHVQTFLRMTEFKAGMTLLETFMGTSRMGEEVIRRGGSYIGYELAKKHYLYAEKRLNRAWDERSLDLSR